MTNFSEVLDAADKLSVDEQETLMEILSRRIAERNRERLVRDIAEARAEFADGPASSTSVRDIMDEVSGES
jgi:hypothetical protein